MPKIFSEEKKRYLYRQLKENCVALMKEKGYRGFNIRDLAKMTGISPGTFYHFFASKEALILEIMKDCQNRLYQRFLDIYKLSGGVGREDFLKLYYCFFVEEEQNLYRYLSRDDLTALCLRSDHPFPLEAVKRAMLENAKLLVHPRKDINLNAVLNFIQLINLCIENRDILIQEEWTHTVERLLHNMAEEIFEEEGKP